MTVELKELINPVVTDELIQKMCHYPPSHKAILESEFLHPIYRSKMLEEQSYRNACCSCLIELAASPISIKNPVQVPEQAEIFGEIDEDNTDYCSSYLAAVSFDLFQQGNCLNRAAYAGFTIAYHNLPNVKKIILKSKPEIDHFFLVLELEKPDKESGWFIYDPLINPEVLFNETEHSNEIYPLFKPVKRPAEVVCILLNKPRYLDEFRIVKEKITKFFRDRISLMEVDDLMMDNRLVYTLYKLHKRTSRMAQSFEMHLTLQELKTSLEVRGLHVKKIKQPEHEKVNKPEASVNNHMYSLGFPFTLFPGGTPETVKSDSIDSNIESRDKMSRAPAEAGLPHRKLR